MSTQSAKQPNNVEIKAVAYKLNTAKLAYRTSAISVVPSNGSLIDGGANGGLGGADVRLISTSNALADISGINNTTIMDVPISTFAGLVETTEGPTIDVMHQYAYVGKGNTIHSVNQLEAFGLQVDDKPKYNNGKQCITTPDGFIIPLAIRSGLAYLDMRPPSDAEFESLPHITFTSDAVWDPSALDSEVDLNDYIDPVSREVHASFQVAPK
jgi:hypothetical protein